MCNYFPSDSFNTQQKVNAFLSLRQLAGFLMFALYNYPYCDGRRMHEFSMLIAPLSDTYVITNIMPLAGSILNVLFSTVLFFSRRSCVSTKLPMTMKVSN